MQITFTFAESGVSSTRPVIAGTQVRAGHDSGSRRLLSGKTARRFGSGVGRQGCFAPCRKDASSVDDAIAGANRPRASDQVMP
ncbi:hypothetical protein G6F57_020899 [Rhizopus arrhizus]|nr:hypothetical protein G6F65_019761 [Rhizopus arrhizus]KAG1435926.1 hypothetical protein G6F57_020899 [Rhizopus arrhizus]